MKTVVFDAQVELSMPSEIEPLEYSHEAYGEARIKISGYIEIKDAVLVIAPDGKRMVIPRLAIKKMAGTMMFVIEGDKVVVFRIEQQADKPLLIEAQP